MREVIRVEVRDMPRLGHSADIDQQLDVKLFQETLEFVKRPIGVADGMDKDGACGAQKKPLSLPPGRQADDILDDV